MIGNGLYLKKRNKLISFWAKSAWKIKISYFSKVTSSKPINFKI